MADSENADTVGMVVEPDAQPLPSAGEDAASEPVAAAEPAAESEEKAEVAAEKAATPETNTGTQAAGGVLDAPLVQEGKRQRKKTVEVYSVPTPEKKKEEFKVEAGPGTELGEIPNVKTQLESHKGADLKDVHQLLFGKLGKEKEVKRHIRAFSGFPDTLDEAKKTKRKEALNAKFVPQLQFFAKVLDVNISGTKANMVDQIWDFCCSPEPSGNKDLKEVKAAKREKKAKAAAKKSKKKKTKASSTSGMTIDDIKKVKSALMFYAISVRNKVKAENPTEPKEELMKMIKMAYLKLSPDKKAKWEKEAKKDEKRYAAEVKAVEEAEELDEDLFDSDEEEEKPKKRKAAPKKKPAAKKAKKAAAADNSDDDEPLGGSNSDPTDDDLEEAVAEIVAEGDLAELTKRKVMDAISARFPSVDMDAKKALLRAAIVTEVQKRQEEEASDDEE